MNDLLDEFDPLDEESDLELDIFADRANTTTSVLETSNTIPALKKKKSAGRDYAQDSTLISLQQYENDCTAEHLMYDHSFSDISLLEDGGDGGSELLRKTTRTP